MPVHKFVTTKSCITRNVIDAMCDLSSSCLKMITSVDPQILVFFLSLFPFPHQAFQVGPFCSICMKRVVVVLWLLCCLLTYNFGGWRWTKCHSAYLLPFSLAYVFTFNLCIWNCRVFSTHSVRWKSVHEIHFHFVPLGNAHYFATGVRNHETLSVLLQEWITVTLQNVQESQLF